jgi:hypothetical protein
MNGSLYNNISTPFTHFTWSGTTAVTQEEFDRRERQRLSDTIKTILSKNQESSHDSSDILSDD